MAITCLFTDAQLIANKQYININFLKTLKNADLLELKYLYGYFQIFLKNFKRAGTSVKHLRAPFWSILKS